MAHEAANDYEGSPLVERAVRWLESHPRTVLTGALVVTTLAAALLSLPGSVPPEDDAMESPAEDSDAPLFV